MNCVLKRRATEVPNPPFSFLCATNRCTWFPSVSKRRTVEGGAKLLILFLLVVPSPKPWPTLPLIASAPQADLAQSLLELQLGFKVPELFLQKRLSLLLSFFF